MPAAGAGEPVFTVHTAAGVAGAGPLQKIGADWSVRLGGPKPLLVTGDDFVSLRRRDAALPPYPTGEQVILADGQRLPLDPKAPLRLADEVLSLGPRPPLRPAAGVELRVPLSRIAVLWLVASPGQESGRQLRRLLGERRQRDRVLLRGGDVLEGAVLSLDRGGSCAVKAGPKTTTIPFAQVAAVAFSTELLARPRPRGAYGHLVLSNGCRLELASATVDAEGARLMGKTTFGAAIAVPLAGVAALDLRQGRAVYLSDLEPMDFVQTPFLGDSWPLTRDAGVTGRQLCLGGSCYDKGLGMHAESRATYDLAGKYEWFEAMAGLDQRTGRLGRVLVEVLVDGKRQALGPGAELIGTGPPLPIRIAVRGARRLTLAVRFAGSGGVQAHVDWADARLLTVPSR